MKCWNFFATWSDQTKQVSAMKQDTWADPDEFPHMKGLYCVHLVYLQSGEGGKIIFFEFIFIMHFINGLWGKGLMHSYALWDSHAYYLCFMSFWKTHTLLYIIDVKWLILVREIRLTYLSLNYNFGNWFLCEKPPHTNLPLFSIIGWENQGHGWRVFGWFRDFSHYVLEDSLRSYIYGSCFFSFVIRSYYYGSRN